MAQLKDESDSRRASLTGMEAVDRHQKGVADGLESAGARLAELMAGQC